MSEILKPTPHALVARFMYEDRTLKHAVQADQYPLIPGAGVVFTGQEDLNSEAFSFQQSDLSYVLKNVEPGKLQLLTLLDINTGNLFFTQGTEDTSYGIGKDIPRDQRVITAKMGRLQFAGIWGESKKEVSETLQRLQKGRIGLN